MTLSPTLTLFLEPHGKLFLKLQHVLAQLQVDGTTLDCSPEAIPRSKRVWYGSPRDRLKLAGRQVVEARMQAFGSKDLFNTLLQVALGLLKRAILLEIDLIVHEGLEEAFGPGIVIAVAGG